MVVKPSTFKIPTFDGIGPWELYHKQFEAVAVHNQRNDAEKALAVTVHLKGQEQQVLIALLRSDTMRRGGNLRTVCSSLETDYRIMQQTSDASLKKHIQAWTQNLWKML